jgi:hypothetical protein
MGCTSLLYSVPSSGFSVSCLGFRNENGKPETGSDKGGRSSCTPKQVARQIFRRLGAPKCMKIAGSWHRSVRGRSRGRDRLFTATIPIAIAMDSGSSNLGSGYSFVME